MASPTPPRPAAVDELPPVSTGVRPVRVLHLAVELRVKIANEIDKNDIFNLRLASFELKEAAEDRFIEEYFTERTHLLEVRSMKVLKAITEDRRLIRKLKKVELVPAVLTYAFKCMRCSPGLCDTDTCENKVKVMESFVGERDKLAAHGLDLIESCLSNIQAAGVTPEIGIHEKLLPLNLDLIFKKHRPVYGQASLDARLGIASNRTIYDTRPRFLCYLSDFEQSLELVLYAVASTEFPLHQLSIRSPRGDHEALEPSEHELLPDLARPLAGMKKFAIADGHLLTDGTRGFLSNLVAIAQSISRLTPGLTPSGGRPIVFWAYQTFASNSLEELNFTSGKLGMSDMSCDIIPLLDKHRQSLRRLTFKKTHFFEDASKYFQWFAENLQLQYFAAKSLEFNGCQPPWQPEMMGKVTHDVKDWLLGAKGRLEKAENAHDRDVHPENYPDDGEVDYGAGYDA